MIGFAGATLLIGLTLTLYGGAFATESFWKGLICAIIGLTCVFLSMFFVTQEFSMREVNKFINHQSEYQVDTLMSNGQIKLIVNKK